MSLLSPSAAAPNRSRHGWLAALLLVSGALALVYEVLWQRQFALVLGSSAPATAAVLAAYFGGLGTGSWVMGRQAGRWKRPLRVYAGLELLAGLGALLVSPLIAASERVGGDALAAIAGDAPGVVMAGRVALVAAVLFIPTFCLGGTLPLLGEIVDRGEGRLGLTAGWLYVANTLGAAAGALLVPFWLLATFGLQGTVALGAAVNFGLAAAAWWLDRRGYAGGPAPAGLAPGEERTAPSSLGGYALAALALGSGAATFALQVLWNRAFAQVHENSMYSFAVIVAAVIFSLAVGAQLARWGLQRGLGPRRLIGGAWLLAGLVVLAWPALFLKMTDGLGYLPESAGWFGHASELGGLAGVLVFPPMVLLGIGLPAIMEAAGAGRVSGAGRVLGRLLSLNIAGSVAGAVAAGFLLPHWLGLWGGMMWIGAVLALGGGYFVTGWTGANARRIAALTLGAVALIAVVPLARVSWPVVRLSAGETLVSVTEGTHGVVAVTQRPGSRRLKLNNHYGLGGTAATGDERMQAHVPLLLHPAPRRVAFLGVGTGISAGGATFHPVEQVTAVELVPEVIATARAHFGEENRRILDDRRTRVVTDDARHFLRGTRERFDVIVGDLVVPWRAGEAALFTLEQFQLARDALAPGGVFCQWLPLFQLSEAETTILIRTFLEVFPEAEVWRGDFSPVAPAIALLGTAEGFRADVATVRRRLREMNLDTTNAQLAAPGVFWMQRVGRVTAADLRADERRINREDRPWIELLGPLAHGGGRAGALFTGRTLQAWLDAVQRRTRAAEAGLPEPEKTAAEAAPVFADLVLRIAERDQAGSAAREAELRGMLPAESLRVLFP